MQKFHKLTDFIRTTFNEPTDFIPLHDPRFIGNEIKYMQQCIESNFVSSVGEFVAVLKECVPNTQVLNIL